MNVYNRIHNRGDKNMSKKYTLNRENLLKIFKVILWSGIAGGIGMAIVVLEEIELPAKWVFIAPTINTILYSLKEFFSGE